MGSSTETLRLIIEASSKGASQTFAQVSKDADKAGESVTTLNKAGAGIGSAFTEGLKGGLIGAGVVASITGLINSFTEGALGAQQLGKSLNSSTEDASKFATKLDTVGLGTKDLIEIQAEFQTATQKNGEALGDLGVEYSRNSEGQIDWQATLVDTLDAMDGVGDASERNQKMVELFGEEGSKQLSGLVTDGQSLKETLDGMPALYTDDDAEKARKLSEAMAEVKTSATQLGSGIASMLVGPLTTVMDLFSGLLDLMGQLPPGIQTALIAIGGIALKFGSAKDGVKAFKDTFEMGVLTKQMSALESTGSEKLTLLGGTFTRVGAGIKGVGSGIVAGLGGPIPAAMAGLSLAWGAIESAVASADSKVATFGTSYAEAVKSGVEPTEALAQSAEGLVDSWSLWERFGKSITNPFKDMSQIATEDMKEYIAEVGLAAVQTQAYQGTQKSLADTIAAGVTSGTEFTTAVTAQGEAMVTQANNQAIATSAMDAYKAATIGAVDSVLALTNAQLGAESQWYAMQTAVWNVSQTVDDAKTPWNEIDVAQNKAMQSVMSYAASTAAMAAQNDIDAGKVSDAWGQASSKADAYIGALKESMAQPGMTAEMQADIQRVIDKITEAKDTGNIEVLASLVGGDEVATETDALGGEKSEATVPVVSEGVDKTKKEIEGIATYRYPDATIKIVTTGIPEASQAIASAASAPHTSTINVVLSGVAAAEAALNSLARNRSTTVTQNTIVNAPAPGPAGAAAPSADAMGARMAATPATDPLGGYAGGYTLPTTAPNYRARDAAPAVTLSVSDRLADYIELEIERGNARLTRAIRSYARQGVGGGML